FARPHVSARALESLYAQLQLDRDRRLRDRQPGPAHAVQHVGDTGVGVGSERAAEQLDVEQLAARVEAQAIAQLAFDGRAAALLVAGLDLDRGGPERALERPLVDALADAQPL